MLPATGAVTDEACMEVAATRGLRETGFRGAGAWFDFVTFRYFEAISGSDATNLHLE